MELSKDDVKFVLSHPKKIISQYALSLVALRERERIVVQLRYIDGLTREETVERIPRLYAELLGIDLEKSISKYEFSCQAIKKWETNAIERCRTAWSENNFIETVINTSKDYPENN